ncbi:MAG: DnaJ domain-containing protein [Clostridia bacterium]|nr:DnaJ domain-containing protein [Clostridia bacterium]
MVDPYTVLGVDASASDAEITKAYRTKARLYHPDTHPGDKTAEMKMKELNAAYDLIKDIRAGKTADPTKESEANEAYYRDPRTGHYYRTYYWQGFSNGSEEQNGNQNQNQQFRYTFTRDSGMSLFGLLARVGLMVLLFYLLSYFFRCSFIPLL